MDPALYKAATQGNVQMLKQLIQNDPKLLNSVTPQDNTALHIASRLGHKDFAEETLKKANTLLILKNTDDDTPLHIAARAGHLNIVELLITYSLTWPTDIEREEVGPFRMINKQQNTPLHEAVQHQNSAIAMKLLNAEPSVGHMENAKKETPLHIAARGGLKDVVLEILEQPFVEGPEVEQPLRSGTGSPLHQAVLGGDYGIMEILLEKRSDFIKVVDESGNSALHYAAQKNNGKMVELLLRREPSLAYAKNYDERSALHIAAAYGSNSVIKELLKQCPDAAEQVDGTGNNALHIAVMSRTVGALKCLLSSIQHEDIINRADQDGNTPLHLAAKNARMHSTLLLLKDRRVNPCIMNNEGHTASRIIESLEEMDTYEYMYTLRSLKKTEERKCKKHHQLSEVGATRRPSRKKMSTADEYFKSCVGTYTLVAALIATVTFAATFTMPGGYDQQHGNAILARHAAFKAFVISNTIAMCSSLIVVFCFIWAWKDPVRFKYNQLIWGHRLTVLASLAMIVTLMSAVYVVVAEDSQWLAIVVCLICFSAPFILWAILGQDILFIPL